MTRGAIRLIPFIFDRAVDRAPRMGDNYFTNRESPMTAATATIEPGQKFVNVDHPEWGTWTVVSHVIDGVWEVRGRSGSKTLGAGQLLGRHFRRVN